MTDAGRAVSHELEAFGTALLAQLRRHAGKDGRRSGAIADAIVEARGAQQETESAARFVARLLGELEPAPEALAEADLGAIAQRAALIYATLDPSFRLHHELSRIAARAYRATAGALAPYLEEGDLLAMLRWRVWRIPAARVAGLRESKGWLAYLDVTARHLAIDELRKIARHPVDPNRLPPDEETAPAEAPEVERRAMIFGAVRHAFEAATQDLPAWLAEAALDALSERRGRPEILAEINRERAKIGADVWSANAFNVFLHRVRRKLRRELEEQVEIG